MDDSRNKLNEIKIFENCLINSLNAPRSHNSNIKLSISSNEVYPNTLSVHQSVNNSSKKSLIVSNSNSNAINLKNESSHILTKPINNMYLENKSLFTNNLYKDTDRKFIKKHQVVTFSSDEEIKNEQYESIFLIYHYALWKQYFDIIVFTLIIYNVIVVPYKISLYSDYDYGAIEKSFEILIDSIFFFDLLFGFFTSYEDSNHTTIIDLKKISKRYLFSWFVVDLVSINPYSYIINQNTSFKLARVAKLPKIYRILKIAK